MNKGINSNKRRDFIKKLGGSILGVSALSSCERPVEKLIPFLIEPENYVPGKAEYVSCFYQKEHDFVPLLGRIIDGRPVRLDVNEQGFFQYYNHTHGALASLLSLYDVNRLKNPTIKSEYVGWSKAIENTRHKLQKSNIALVTSPVYSPSLNKLIKNIRTSHKLEHIVYEEFSREELYLGDERAYGKPVSQTIYPEKAGFMLSVGSDFLIDGQFGHHVAGRYLGQREKFEHIHFDVAPSFTGQMADEDVRGSVREAQKLLQSFFDKLTGKRIALSGRARELYEKLIRHKSKSIVLNGFYDATCQFYVHKINHYLQNTGSTIEISFRAKETVSRAQDFERFLDMAAKGAYDALILFDVDPVGSTSNSERLFNAFENINHCMQIGHRKNASSSACTHFFASHHPYETWRDYQADTFYAVSQPLIKPLFNTLPAHSVLAGIFGEKMDDYTAIKDDFEEQNITASWDELLRSGGSETKMKRNNTSPVMLKKNAPSSSDEEEGENYTVFVKQNIRLKYKEYYENPWLRECPDPFSRISWDDYLVVSSEVADHLNLEDGDEVLLNGWLQLPAYIQKNMHARSMILYWGTFDFAAASDDMNYEKKIWKNIRIRKTGTKTQFARIQTELNTSLPDHYFRPLDNKKEYLEKHYNGSKETFPMHHWGMVIDLDKCHGCNLCSIACINENNIPVVGREEILRRHEMHWLRVDRYYDNRGEMIFLPVMCQHCDEAPCENVCPVSATSQSKEGLNQMTYNRCIGARYCSNNCPYKVRRFNWKAYTGANGWFSKDYDPAGMNNDLTRMVLNPDITIRSRGVMEKCSFCIQRIAEKRQSAIMENRLLKDGEIKTACQQACPNNAIVFGDLKDQDSKVRHMIDNNEAYQLMGDLSTHPTVWYIKRKKT